MLKAVDDQLGLSEALAACLRDGRPASKVKHSPHDALRQRIFGIALGHPDANDATRLTENPVHKLLLDRDPFGGDRLASQPTLSRWENSVGSVYLLKMSTALAQTVLGRHKRRLGSKAKKIALDFDPTEDPTHGLNRPGFPKAMWVQRKTCTD